MSRFVRTSKVRHVFCDPEKTENQYHGLRVSSATGDHNYIKANTKYFAYAVQSGSGALTVIPLQQVGKINPVLPVLDGHRGAVLDFDFNPFHEQIIVSGGDDCTVKAWQIPQGGLTENIVDPLVNMSGHEKKVSVVRFHPTADSVLATGSADTTVRVWDIQTGDCKTICRDNSQLIQDVVWNTDGSMLATSCKDKQMRLVDPRTGLSVAQVEAHNGTKTSKLVFIDWGRLVSVGFTRASKRQFKIWDARQLHAPVATCDIDQAAGAMMPFYDQGTKLLYLCGKGDGNIRYYELTDDSPFQYHVGEYRGASPAKGLAMLPKRTCDVSRCEVTKFLKLTKDAVEPLSFIVPRKSEIFQRDLYPDAYAGRMSMTADEFFDGEDRPPVTISLDPEVTSTKHESDDPCFVPLKSSRQLEEELFTAKEYIHLLEQTLLQNEIKLPASK
mmetsp:Transcript_20148/g.33283  ORF Transcript_20148/g.33283 Transcript_20148/m.33283 type:complete len:442 (+) Transcript_20148:885-2210(+)